VGDGDHDQDHAQPVASSTSDADGAGRWNMRSCSGVWRCRQAHAGSPSPLALVPEAIPTRPCLACCGHAEMRFTAGGSDVDEQPGFVIEGTRVALGPLRMDLVATYQRWENDLEVANANGRVIPFTLEAERERIAGRNGKPEFCDFTVYDRADQAPIGWSSLFHIDHRNGTAQFGIDLGERRGQGLGTEATRLTLDWGFSVLGLHNIMLAVAAWNERAIRVYTRVGFREVGRRRGAGHTMGRRHDGVFMDLLATEFLQAGGSVLAGRAPHGLRPASR
jgi:diamine N-acetyltransferase